MHEWAKGSAPIKAGQPLKLYLVRLETKPNEYGTGCLIIAAKSKRGAEKTSKTECPRLNYEPGHWSQMEPVLLGYAKKGTREGIIHCEEYLE